MSGTALQAMPLLHCSFCTKSEKEVQKLVAGPGVYICDVCIRLCNQIIVEEGRTRFFGDELHERSEEELIDLMVRVQGSHDGIDLTVQWVVRELRARRVSWARIGDALGMTRQSAWERFSGEE